MKLNEISVIIKPHDNKNKNKDKGKNKNKQQQQQQKKTIKLEGDIRKDSN